VRSNGSRKFVNSPQRIPTVRSFLDDSLRMTKCSSTELVHLRANLRCLLKLQGHNFPALSFNISKALSFLSFLITLSLRKDSCTHSLRQPSNTSSVEFLSTLRTPAAAVSQCFTQVHNPETSLGLRTPCTALCLPNCTSEMNENKSYPI
jgi:hypothetical protein